MAVISRMLLSVALLQLLLATTITASPCKHEHAPSPPSIPPPPPPSSGHHAGGHHVESSPFGVCANKSQRKAWHKLTDQEKKAYIDAEICLMSSPSRIGLAFTETRWDELVYAHIIQANWIHRVGSFFPWHRYFLTVHETLLRTECGYAGAQPYWDEALDADNNVNISQSAIFDPDTGFGGQGGECVTDGPFADTTLRLKAGCGGGEVLTDSYCLTRSFDDVTFRRGINSTVVAQCLASEGFTAAEACLEVLPHASAHAGVGGTMVDISASPGDPLFYLHHANLDRLWWKWQQADPSNRTYDIGSVSNIPPPLSGAPPGDLPKLVKPQQCDPGYPQPESGDGAESNNMTTLNHNLWVVGILPNVTIYHVMDLGGPTICAEYVE